MSEKQPPLRILCLHGYRQSETIFRQKTGSLRKILKNKADLVYMTAPHVIPNDEDPVQHGWWFSTEERTYKAVNYTDCCIGLDESIDKVNQFIEQNGPFDGVLGFSQGASLLSIICALREKSDESFPFKFVVLIAGFQSRQSQHKEFYTYQYNIPSLLVIGDTDQVIPQDMSNELVKNFVNPTILRHPGGHFVPTSAAQKAQYIEFLNRFRV